jgi:hypothetical protein
LLGDLKGIELDWKYIFRGRAGDFNPSFAEERAGAQDEGSVENSVDGVSDGFGD